MTHIPAQPAIQPGHHAAGPVVLIGGGGHATVVFEAARLAGHSVVGFLDDNPAAPLAAILIDLPHPFPTPPHLGPLNNISAIGASGWILALGDLRARRHLLGSLLASLGNTHAPQPAAKPVSIIHPTAFVSPTASIGLGVYIGPKAVIHSRAKIGHHAIINSGAIVEHDCVIDENAHLAPASVLGGTVHIGRDSLIGLGSRILPGVAVGAGCTIGAGAVVTRNARDGATLVGVPAHSKR